MSKSILLTGGGTGGHIFPNLALVPELEKRFEKVYYMGGDGPEKRIVEGKLPYFEVCSPKFSRALTLNNLKIPFELHAAKKQAERIIAELSPSVIFGKGGYVSLPAMLAGLKLGIPTIAHESDFTVGLANKLAQRKGARLLTAFPIGYEDVGMPIRNQIFCGNASAAEKQFGVLYQKGKPCLLIIGGSGGAQAINRAVYSILEQLTTDYNVVHISGKTGDFSIYRQGYLQLPFAENVQDFYELANLVISRAGATAVAELSALNKPTILIPLPKGASRGDQELNARYATCFGAKVVIQDHDLAGNITEALKTPPKQFRECVPNGTYKIVDICSKFAESKQN